MSNLNVEALKKLFPKNTTRRQGGKVNGANRKRVQVMLPPDTLARLDELIEHDEQARSAAVALGVEVVCAIFETEGDAEKAERTVAEKLADVTEPDYACQISSVIHWLGHYFRDAALPYQP